VKLSFHDPARYAAIPSDPAALATMASNQQSLRVYTGPRMHDPALRARLTQVDVPAMVIWGASDRIVDADYGRLFAASMPGARFELVPEAGHFPQIERLDTVLELLAGFDAG